ncbi:MAG: hypothetical protein IPL40_14510 [Proteobacteria bacterium]|nr:hypothetical protein [Pseudomonadota bacterium]
MPERAGGVRFAAPGARLAMALAAAGLFAGLAVGCAAKRERAATTRGRSVAGVAPDSGELLALGLPQLPAQLNPLQGGGDLWAWRIMRGNVVEALVDRGADGRALPRLARTVEWTDQGRRLRLGLRRGVRFHDGPILNSAHVAAALEEVLRPRSVNPALRLALADIAEVTTPAPDVVELKLRRLNYQLPLALAAVPIVRAWRPVERSAAGAQPLRPVIAGTGPYLLTPAPAPELLVLRRFGRYWGPPPPIARIELRAVPDPARALGALRNGEIDVLAALHPGYYPAEVSGRRFDRRFRLRRLRPHQLRVLWFNLRRRVLDDRRVRQGLARLADGAALAATLGGEVQPLGRVLWGSFGAVQGAVGGAARAAGVARPAWAAGGGGAPLADGAALLTWSGWQRKGGGWRQRDGRTLALRLLCAREGPGRHEAEQIARRLREAGVGVSVELGDFGFVRVQLQRGNFDLALSGLTVPEGDELSMYLRSDGALNFVHYENAAADALLDALRTAPPQSDRSAWQVRLLQLLADDPPWVGLYVARELSVVSRRVEGWRDDGRWPEFSTLRLRPN